MTPCNDAHDTAPPPHLHARVPALLDVVVGVFLGLLLGLIGGILWVMLH